jgi:hypothetical protein
VWIYEVSFVIIDNDSVKFVTFDIDYSRRKKKITKITKFRLRPTSRDTYEKLENGNIVRKSKSSETATATHDQEYYSTENFRKTSAYTSFKPYLPELLDLEDNYAMLEYLDSHFTKYSGPEEYRNAPLLKKEEQ